MKKNEAPFGSQGPEDHSEPDGDESPANELKGAKGGGMKHVVSPGADEAQKRKHMMMIAMMRAMHPQMGGGAPMGGPSMPPMGGMGGGY